MVSTRNERDSRFVSVKILLEWVTARGKRISPSGTIIKGKAKELTHILRKKVFSASIEWLDKIKENTMLFQG